MIGEKISVTVVVCGRCSGRGKVWEKRADDYGHSPEHDLKDCPICRGHGRIQARTVIQCFTMDEDARNLDTVTNKGS